VNDRERWTVTGLGALLIGRATPITLDEDWIAGDDGE
jgi:hypothetical protein